MTKIVKRARFAGTELVVYFIDGSEFNYDYQDNEAYTDLIKQRFVEFDPQFDTESFDISFIDSDEGYASIDLFDRNFIIDNTNFIVYSPQHQSWFELPREVALEVVNEFEY